MFDFILTILKRVFFFFHVNELKLNLTENKKKEENNENKQNIMHTHLHQESPSTDVMHNSIHNQQQQQQPQQQTSNQSSMASISNLNIPTSNQPLSWTCELCGRMFGTRDEWSIHAKSHLEVCNAKLFFRE